MTNAQWARVWELYETASGLPASEAEHFLQSSTDDADVVKEAALALAASQAEGRAEEAAPEWRHVGRRVGRYKVVAPLGRGGSGEVYIAEDLQLGRTVALKFITDYPEDEKSTSRRFFREAQAASALNHPNIVTVYEVVADDLSLAIAMELVEGKALRALCGTALPWKEVARYGLQTARALAAAHSRGIVHRDVKPENVMVRPDGYIKLLDFGIARNTGNPGLGAATTNAGLAMGTLSYMSPEQCRGERASAASDVFSLGLVLYELTAGRHPFQADLALEVAHGIIRTEPKPPSASITGVPPALDSLILRMLAKDPALRCSAAEAAEKLEDILAVSSPAKAGRWRVYTAVAAVALIAGLAAWAVTGNKGTATPLQLRPIPLTAQTGWEMSPAISPDGSSVAFAWSEHVDSPKRIYVKRLDEASPVAVTSSNFWAGSPTWSADGSRIYYVRWDHGPGAIWSISKDGGDGAKILELRTADLSSSIDSSPDGRWLAFGDREADGAPMSGFLLNLATREKRRLTVPPAGFWGDWDPKFSPDGRTIAFKRVKGYWQDYIYLVPAGGGTPRKLNFGGQGIWGHAWMRDGKSLLLSCQRGGTIFGLWRFPTEPTGTPTLIGEGGFDSILPASARGSTKIAWVNQVTDLNLYRISAAGGAAPVQVFASTLRDTNPAWASDGRVAFLSDRSGSLEMWLARSGEINESQAVKVTSFLRGPTGTPHWSADGGKIVATAYGDGAIVILECEPGGVRCGAPTRLSGTIPNPYEPSWSSNGKSIYYATDQVQTNGLWNIVRQPAAGGPATVVTRNGGLFQAESSDGKWLYFSKPASGIWRMPAPRDGTAEAAGEELLVALAQGRHVWALGTDEIFFFRPGDEQAHSGIYAWSMSTRKTRSVMPTASIDSLTVSPDQSHLLYSQLDRSGANVLVADDVPLEGSR